MRQKSFKDLIRRTPGTRFIARPKCLKKDEFTHDSVSYRHTICELCGNENCAEMGRHNIHMGHKSSTCRSYKPKQDSAAEMPYSTHHDPRYRDD